MNLSDAGVLLPEDTEVLLASSPVPAGRLPPDHAVWPAVV